ncbi:MAG: SH3 domain-containing protein [Anaerolineales bacterium]|nr:SH3 domain-containing protein [Anaerolineales bacterium]
MKKQLFLFLTLSLIAMMIISACGSSDQAPTKTPKPTKTSAAQPVASPLPTATPDPCAPENLPAEVEKVHKLMREFDDISLLAPDILREMLYPVISDLQRVRRDVEDLQVPSCLVNLKQYELAHMNTVINVMVYLLRNGPDANPEVVSQGIAQAKQQHDQYILELANVLGLTVVAAPTTAPVQGTPEAGGTPAPAALVITNSGPTAVNLRDQPDLNAGTIGILDLGANAVVLGRTADALWYQVEFPGQPGQTAWVYASLVQLSDPTAELPVITP